jgi:hypothetical protein
MANRMLAVLALIATMFALAGLLLPSIWQHQPTARDLLLTAVGQVGVFFIGKLISRNQRPWNERQRIIALRFAILVAIVMSAAATIDVARALRAPNSAVLPIILLLVMYTARMGVCWTIGRGARPGYV